MCVFAFITNTVSSLIVLFHTYQYIDNYMSLFNTFCIIVYIHHNSYHIHQRLYVYFLYLSKFDKTEFFYYFYFV